LIAVDYETDVGGVELMLRSWNVLGDPCGCTGCGGWCSGQSLGKIPLSVALGVGVRYLNIGEEFSVYSQFGPTPSPTGLQDYLYHIDAENHLVGCQVDLLANTSSWNDFDFVFSLKGMLAANFISTDVSLREFTGALAFDESQDEVAFAQAVSAGAYLRWRPFQCVDFRAGYQVLWVNGYAGASDQFSHDLSQPGHFDDENSVLFHGPSMVLTVMY
jgi:hypothetical protein